MKEICKWISDNIIDKKGNLITSKIRQNSQFFKLNKDKYDYIKTLTKNLQEDTKISVRIYHVMNDIENIPTCYCGKHTTFSSFKSGYNKYCSLKCSQQCPTKKSNTSKQSIKTNKKIIQEKYIPIWKSQIKDKFGDLNIDWNKVINKNSLVEIYCDKHNTYETKSIQDLLKQKYKCKQCGKEAIAMSVSERRKKSKDDVLKTLKELKPDLDFSKFEWVDVNHKTIVICPIHGEYITTYHYIKNSKHNCPKCAIDTLRKSMTTNQNDIINFLEDKYPTFDFSEFEYIGRQKPSKVKCDKHGFFETTFDVLANAKYGCPKCAFEERDIISKSEKEIYDFVCSIFNKELVEQSNRNVLDKKELDIYVPSKKFAIEYNGIFWHSSKFKDYKYHYNKTKECMKKDIFLFHVFEDQWQNKKEIIKSMIKSKLGVIENKYYARKCEIREVATSEAMIFLDKNHLQGKVGSNKKLGLYYKNELVALMTFSEKPDEAILTRFCSKLNTIVIGGFNKLLNNYIKQSTVKEIVTFADLTYSYGNLYKEKFEIVNEQSVGYFYIDSNMNRYHASSFTKSKIKDKFDLSLSYVDSKTERELMSELGYYRIYDSGKLKFSYILRIRHEN